MAGRRASVDSAKDEHRASHLDLDYNPDIFDDEYASSIISHPDPHRSPSPTLSPDDNLPSTSSATITPPQSTNNIFHLSDPSTTQSSNHDRQRGSISKPAGTDNPFSDSHESPRPSNSFVRPFPTHNTPHRALSSASSTSYARTQSPFQESVGPSHPYDMYPQDLGISRSTSTATASTRTGPQNTTTRSGPAHPYAMYPQGVSDGDEEHEAMPPVIPVGFPGHTANYHRRLGPEGEEQDIVGPDGHAEQLPPYSRYPEEPAKAHIAAPLPVIGESTHQESPSTPTRVTSHHESQRPGSEPFERRSSPGHQQLIGPTSSGHDYDESTLENSSRSTSTEKAWSEKTWREKRKTRIGCMPVWAIALAIAGALVLCTIVGAVIGGVVGTADAKDETTDQKPSHIPSNYLDSPAYSGPVTVTETITSLIDATPISSPLAPPPTGVYDLPVLGADNEQDSCLKSPQNNAWDCRLTSDFITVQISAQASDSDCPTLSFPNQAPDVLQYGAQAPRLPSQNLTVVQEVHNATNGPAYHFQTTYNKMIVIHEMELMADEPDNHTLKRSFDPYMKPYGMPLGGWLSKTNVPAGQVVRASERPWFCYFNDTFIEGFVFMDMDINSLEGLASSSLAPLKAPATTASSAAAELTPANAANGDVDEAADIYEGVDDGYGGYGAGDSYGAGTTPTPTQPPAYYPPLYRRSAAPVNYPKLFKIEERRVPPPPGVTTPPAYCQQMLMNDHGVWTPYTVPVLSVTQTVMLIESDPVAVPTDMSGAQTYDEGQWESGCYCRWENM